MFPGELGPGAEPDLIRRLLGAAGHGSSEDVLLGAGDDAAVLRAAEGEHIVVSTDMAVEEVHFRRAWCRWETVGWRATAAALSDLAAMAARPLGVLLSVALPPELEASVLEELGRGVGACLEAHGGALLGGDLARSPGPVVVDVAVVGSTARPVARGGAEPGDELWITGELGAAATAVADWSRGLEPEAEARRAFERPVARLEEGRWLAEEGEARALIDLSDGLARDAGHLAAASGLAAVVETAAVPRSEVLDGWADDEAALRRALTGGEDYELLLAAPPGVLAGRAAVFRERFEVALSRVGRLEAGEGVRWLDPAGDPMSPPGNGWDHFRDPDR